jgi:hypothetical protein
MKRLALCVLAATVIVAGCGKSEAEKQAEAAAKATEQVAKDMEATAESAAKGLEAMAKGLEQLATGTSPVGEDGKPAEPVKFQDLIALLPQIDGWEQEKPTGQRMTTPFPTANAKAVYTKGDARIEVEIVDSGFNQLLLAPAMMFLKSGYSVENTEGYEKAATVNGQPGWEKWNSESKNGEVNALVGKRFLVRIEGDNIEDTSILKNVASSIDFEKLAALK